MGKDEHTWEEYRDDPGKFVLVEVSVRLRVKVPTFWDDNSIQFHIEEHDCIDNFINQIAAEIEADPGHCKTCSRAKAKYLRESVDEDDFGEYESIGKE